MIRILQQQGRRRCIPFSRKRRRSCLSSGRNYNYHGALPLPSFSHSMMSSAAMATHEEEEEDDHHDDHHDHDGQEALYLRASLSQFLIPQLQSIPQQKQQQHSHHRLLDSTTTPTMEKESPWKEESILHSGEEYFDEEELALFQELEVEYQKQNNRPADDATWRPEESQSININNAPPQHENEKTIIELLKTFDPQNPPQSKDYETREQAMEAIQLWLECEAQQEAVLRYQKILQSARDRKEYSSLSMVQKLIVQWIPPLSKAIESYQRLYLCHEQDSHQQRKKSLKKFGPYLCVLPARKLAVIIAHEALMASLAVENHRGVPLAPMMRKIGEAVEQEVLVHRLLRRRFLLAQQVRRERKTMEHTDTTTTLEFEQKVVELYEKKLKEQDDMDKLEPTKRGDSSGSLMAGDLHRWSYASSHLKSLLDEIKLQNPKSQRQRNIAYAVRKARVAEDEGAPWEESILIQLGAALFHLMQDTCTVTPHDGGEQAEKVFTTEKHWLPHKQKFRSYTMLHDAVFKMIVDDKMESLAAVTSRHKPMIVPPKPWTSSLDGGYRVLKVDMMRFGCQSQRSVLQEADTSMVLDGLNSLGRVKWKINGPVLDVAQQYWEAKIALGNDIPSQTDVTLPPEPLPPPKHVFEKGTPEHVEHMQHFRAYRDKVNKYNRLKQKNMLNQAEKFREFDEIYFPYNIDFRGRAYPIPPHLSNVGSDLCRGVLQFAEAKPLGARGLYWLKVHLANFAGMDKITFDQRAQFVDDNMDKVRGSATDSLNERWWTTLDDPFQGLATCIEITKALESGDPEAYECALPVHMDGSCNGLQHYAALGRDPVGGKAVNLCATDEPQDVYVGVMHEVVRRVAKEAARTLPFDTSNPESLSAAQKIQYKRNSGAKLVDGLIDRNVVKRTVMTSVYGVTYVGARAQIQEKIESKLTEQGYDVDENALAVFQGCGFLASVTMEVIGDLFSGAKGTMNWLTACARLISAAGHPVAWISPVGLPAIQPYRQNKMYALVTILQTLSLVQEGAELPVHRKRQASAFPPNYIHSLDSCHMLLTSLEMDRRGLTFSAVHDSFWTHACDIDEMNSTLRNVFVDLYSQPLLERLKETWELRYPEIEFPELPQRGDLDLQEVRKAPYFFQ